MGRATVFAQVPVRAPALRLFVTNIRGGETFRSLLQKRICQGFIVSAAILCKECRERPVHGGFPAGPKLHRAQTSSRLRVAPGTHVPALAIRATEIPPT
jgi:hypothetical protein